MRRGADVSTTDVQQFVKEEERMKDLFRFHIFKSQRGELHLFWFYIHMYYVDFSWQVLCSLYTDVIDRNMRWFLLMQSREICIYSAHVILLL